MGCAFAQGKPSQVKGHLTSDVRCCSDGSADGHDQARSPRSCVIRLQCVALFHSPLSAGGRGVAIAGVVQLIVTTAVISCVHSVGGSLPVLPIVKDEGVRR